MFFVFSAQGQKGWLVARTFSVTTNTGKKRRKRTTRQEALREQETERAKGRRRACDSVDVETSGTGLVHGNVPCNALEDSAVPSEHKMMFSLGDSTPSGRERQTTGHMSPVELARRRDGDEGSAQLGAMRWEVPHTMPFPRITAIFFPAQPAVRPPHRREEGVHMNKRREGCGDTTSPI